MSECTTQFHLWFNQVQLSTYSLGTFVVIISRLISSGMSVLAGAAKCANLPPCVANLDGRNTNYKCLSSY